MECQTKPCYLKVGGVSYRVMDKQTLDYLQKLCRIACTEEEEADLKKSLERILEYIELLGEVNTDGIKPCNHVIDSCVSELRLDVPQNPMSRDAFLANAPDQIAGMIRIPPVQK